MNFEKINLSESRMELQINDTEENAEELPAIVKTTERAIERVSTAIIASRARIRFTFNSHRISFLGSQC